ncbi:MAG: (2Fe-2S)-binding protein [Puniceicoccales bacterium]|jgi:NADH-quinone oxidoreductase subunit G|nr:(2Fe-2S)-binding protein [Puniceicoccales bacterium]
MQSSSAQVSKSPTFVSINLDGEDVAVPAGKNLIEAVRHVGREIPHYCYHPNLSVAGNCRACLVEVGMPLRNRTTGAVEIGENGDMKIGWQPKPASACTTIVAEGLHVRLDSPFTRACREEITEFLLLNHPLDCPICDKAGECDLQRFSAACGRGFSRYEEEKNIKPKKSRIGPRILLDNERCILCGRCVRFFREVAREPVLGFVNRGSASMATCYPAHGITSNYALNTVDICPVGALTSVDFRFKSRVWFLKQTPSICPESSVGVNTTIWSRDGKILRITPRRNDAVNDCWMPDSGRDLYKMVTAPNRVLDHLCEGVAVGVDEARRVAAALLRNHAGHTAYIASGRLCVEEQVALKKLVNTMPGRLWLPRHIGENDGLLLSEDRTPNMRGALITGLIDRLPDANLDDLAASINAEETRLLVVLREDITTLGVPIELLKKSGVKIIYLSTQADAMASLASVVIPGLFEFEKNGCFVNEQFRLQRFLQAVSAPAGIPPEVETLAWLAASTAADGAESENQNKTQPLAQTGQLAEIHFSDIPDEGLLLDTSPWRHLPFPETKSLHFAGD